jgi:Flp pilus assembly protein TadB
VLADGPLLAGLAGIAGFIALPAVIAMHRRRISREASEVATALAEFARDVRRSAHRQPLDESLRTRAERLRVPELASLLLAQELPQEVNNTRAELVADSAQRLALRLKRRVAFERKMLARTASGRRRGAIAAAIPPLVLLLLRAAQIEVPMGALWSLLLVEGFGCWLLWRLARVEI